MKQKDNNNSGSSPATTKQPREKSLENNYTPWYNQGIGGYDDPSLQYGDQNPFSLFQDIHGMGKSDPLEEGYETEQYEVEPGDSIVGIAEKYNISPEELLSLNNWTLVDPSKGILSSGGETFQLQPGWYVRVPAQKKTQGKTYPFNDGSNFGIELYEEAPYKLDRLLNVNQDETTGQDNKSEIVDGKEKEGVLKKIYEFIYQVLSKWRKGEDKTKGKGGKLHGGYQFNLFQGGADPTRFTTDNFYGMVSLDEFLPAASGAAAGANPIKIPLAPAKTISKATGIINAVDNTNSSYRSINQSTRDTKRNTGKTVKNLNSSIETATIPTLEASYGTPDSAGIFYGKDSLSNGEVRYFKGSTKSGEMTESTKEEFERRWK